MIERFEGDLGRTRLVELLSRQPLVAGDAELAARFAEVVTLEAYEAGHVLIEQGGADTDLLFVLVGRLSVTANGREIAVRTAGDAVGEMAVIDPSEPRSTSVVALNSVVIGRCSDQEFRAIAADHSKIWRSISLQLAGRLRQRDRFHSAPNARPVIFIGSSSEALAEARELEKALSTGESVVRVWEQDVFRPGNTFIDSLLEEVENADFAVLLFSADDEVVSRAEASFAPRDNVIFELGMFMGGLGRGRALLVRPITKDLKIPTDLLGLVVVEARGETSGERANSAAAQILSVVGRLGPR